jgi:hypothetical protein
MEINGKEYPLWSQFVKKQSEFIGGILVDEDGGPPTKITGIELVPNGSESAFFRIKGEDFDCGFDVQFGGIACDSQKPGWLGFSGYAGHRFRIKKEQS